MTAVVKEVYEAFKKVAFPSRMLAKPQQLCRVTKPQFAEFQTELAEIQGELRLHRWMPGVVVALNVGILLKLLVG